MRIERTRIIQKLFVVPVIFWAGVLIIYPDRKWIPPGFYLWPLTPTFLLAFLIGLWPGPYVEGIESIYPKLQKARLIWKVSVWIWLLSFPAPAIILFIARPGTFSLMCKMFCWGFTHIVHPYPY